MCESRANGQVLYLAGIVSTAYEFKESASEERALEVHCGEKDAYGQFTALTWYIDWIKERQTDMADGRNVERLSRFLSWRQMHAIKSLCVPGWKVRLHQWSRRMPINGNVHTCTNQFDYTDFAFFLTNKLQILISLLKSLEFLLLLAV